MHKQENCKTIFSQKLSVCKQQLEKNKCRAIAPTCSVLSKVSKALKEEQQPEKRSTLQQNSAWLCMAGCFCQDHTIVIWYDSHCRRQCRLEQVGFNSNRNGDIPVEIVSKNEIIKRSISYLNTLATSTRCPAMLLIKNLTSLEDGKHGRCYGSSLFVEKCDLQTPFVMTVAFKVQHV